MKTLKYLYYTIFSIFLFTSCVDVVDVKVPEGETLLAVEGMISDQPGPYTVKLTYTAPYFNQSPNPVVTGAQVFIEDSEGFKEALVEQTPGVFITQNITGKQGNKYKLSIKLEDEEYFAETEIKRVPPIDSVTFLFEEKEERGDDDVPAGYVLRYHGPEFEGVGDYYRFKGYRNDSLFNKPDNLLFASDELVDGSYINDFELDDDRRFKIGDKVKVETLSIPEDAYYFFVELFIQINNANAALFANPVANVRTNIKNINPQSTKKAVGYFYGAGISFKEGVLENEKTVIK